MALVTDDVVAALRALLVGDGDDFQRRNAAIGRSEAGNRAYRALLLASFIAAVERNFTAQSSRDSIAAYVADVRSRSPEAAGNIDPDAGERLIRMVFDDDLDLSDIDGNTRVHIELAILVALISDEGLDDKTLDDFLAGARDLANKILA